MYTCLWDNTGARRIHRAIWSTVLAPGETHRYVECPESQKDEELQKAICQKIQVPLQRGCGDQKTRGFWRKWTGDGRNQTMNMGSQSSIDEENYGQHRWIEGEGEVCVRVLWANFRQESRWKTCWVTWCFCSNPFQKMLWWVLPSNVTVPWAWASCRMPLISQMYSTRPGLNMITALKADESQSCEAFRLQFMLGRPAPRHWFMLCCVLSSDIESLRNSLLHVTSLLITCYAQTMDDHLSIFSGTFQHWNHINLIMISSWSDNSQVHGPFFGT